MDFHNATIEAAKLCLSTWVLMALFGPAVILRFMPYSPALGNLGGKSYPAKYLRMSFSCALGTLPVPVLGWMVLLMLRIS